VMRRLAGVGVDMDDVGLTLEDSGVAGFDESFQTMIAGLAGKASQLSRR
jgi:transaldolase